MPIAHLHDPERLPPITLEALAPQYVAEAAIAFANSDGGLIVFPAQAVGSLAALQAALDAALEHIRPALVLDTPQPVALDTGEGWAVYVPRGTQVYALDDGRVLVRTLHTLRELDGEAIRQLVYTREQGDFEAALVPDATSADLDEALLANFAQHVTPDGNEDLWALGEQLGVLTPQDEVTVAGVLLFGYEPQRWLPEAHVHFQYIVANQIVREEYMGGPLIHQMHKLWEALSLHAHIAGPRPPYAPELLREIVFNALIHRDYRLRRRAVEVQLSRTELIVESPGGLGGPMLKAEDIPENRYLRNPRLYHVLTRWGVCKERNARAVSTRAQEKGYPQVHWHVRPDTVRVQIERSVPDVTATSSHSVVMLNEQQRRILRVARQRGSVTLRELQARWNDARPDRLQRDLDTLVAAGYLRRFGGRAAVYYAR